MPTYAISASARWSPMVYPSPKNISVQDMMEATLSGQIFIRMPRTAPHEAASDMPSRNLPGGENPAVLKIGRHYYQVILSFSPGLSAKKCEFLCKSYWIGKLETKMNYYFLASYFPFLWHWPQRKKNNSLCQKWDSNPRPQKWTATWTQRLRPLGHPDLNENMTFVSTP